MPTPPLIDLDSLLRPISDDNPSGESLIYEPEYDAIRDARRSDDSSNVGVWQAAESKVADWDGLVDLGSACLLSKTKDLQIAAWMTEALMRRHSLAGLRDGLRLLHGIQESFWDTYHPEIDEGDLESRLGPFLFLNTTLPPLLRGAPLTRGLGDRPFGLHDWKKSREIENEIRKNPDYLDEMKDADRAVLVRAEDFDTQVAQTPRSFYETLSEDLDETLDAWKTFDDATGERFGDLAPSLVDIKKALEDIRKFLNPILKQKREREPDRTAPEPEAEDDEAVDHDEPEASDDTSEDSDAWPDSEESEAPEDWEPSSSWDDTPEPPPARRTGTRRPPGGPIVDAEDARNRILDAAEYLRQHEASAAAGYLVPRALRLAEVFDGGEQLDASMLEAPSSQTRQSLRRLIAEGDWERAIAEAEAALSRPEGRGWLDAHRMAVQAMENGPDSDRSAPAAASKALVVALLRSYPSLIDQELADGTPAANAETRAWLADLTRPSHQAEPEVEDEPEARPAFEPYVPPPREPGPDEPAQEDDPWDHAVQLAQAGRVAEGIQLLRKALNSSVTGRGKFLRKLQMAELCLIGENYRVALPLAEDLARQVDEFRLEQWEDERLVARVWVALYRCLKATEPAPSDRAQQAFTRLCRLDIDLAMSHGEGALPG